MILLVVDTQKGCFDERLYSFETVRKNIKQLITAARENNVEVVYVPAYTNSTYDNPYFDKETAYKYYNEFMWGRRYAKIITVEQAIQLLQSGKNGV